MSKDWAVNSPRVDKRQLGSINRTKVSRRQGGERTKGDVDYRVHSNPNKIIAQVASKFGYIYPTRASC